MSDSQANAVGFVGLGSQGGAMARRIVDTGFPLMLWARRSQTLEAFADTRATRAATLADLGAHCDHIGVCVVDDAGVREVVAALLPAMRPGSRLVIHSTVHPATCVDLAGHAAARGVSLIDAPVSGGGPAAAAGTLTVMVGGDVEAVVAARPVFDCFAGHVVHLGAVGAGQLAKLINNTLMTANMALGDAALLAAEALGLDRTAFTELIKVSSGRSYGFEVRARLPELATFAHGAALLGKDVGLLAGVLHGDPSMSRLRAVAQPFLDQIATAVETARGPA